MIVKDTQAMKIKCVNKTILQANFVNHFISVTRKRTKMISNRQSIPISEPIVID